MLAHVFYLFLNFQRTERAANRRGIEVSSVPPKGRLAIPERRNSRSLIVLPMQPFVGCCPIDNLIAIRPCSPCSPTVHHSHCCFRIHTIIPFDHLAISTSCIPFVIFFCHLTIFTIFQISFLSSPVTIHSCPLLANHHGHSLTLFNVAHCPSAMMAKLIMYLFHI